MIKTEIAILAEKLEAMIIKTFETKTEKFSSQNIYTILSTFHLYSGINLNQTSYNENIKTNIIDLNGNIEIT